MKKWILVVDDEPDLRDAIKGYLEITYGDEVNVVEAKDGLEATTKLHFQAFSCIITDLNMPRKNGWKLIEEAHSSTLNCNTPVIAITGKSVDPEDRAVEIDILYKPFSISQLIERVDQALKPRENFRGQSDLINKLSEKVQACLGGLKGLVVDQGQPSTRFAGQKTFGHIQYICHFKNADKSLKITFGLEMKLVDYLEVHHLAMQKIEPLDFLKEQVFLPAVDELSDRNLRLDSCDIATASELEKISQSESIQIPIATNRGKLEIGFIKASQNDTD